MDESPKLLIELRSVNRIVGGHLDVPPPVPVTIARGQLLLHRVVGPTVPHSPLRKVVEVLVGTRAVDEELDQHGTVPHEHVVHQA